MISALPIALALALAPRPITDDAFIRSVIEVPAELSGRVFWDVNGDGRRDLVLFTYWDLWVYLQSPRNTFSSRPDQHLRLPAGTTLFAFSDLDGNGHVDLLAMASRAFRSFSLESAEELQIPLPDPRICIFHGLENFAPSHYWRLFENLLDAGSGELVLPSAKGFVVHELRGPRRGHSFLIPYSIEGSLAIDEAGLEARLRKTTRVPLVEFHSIDMRPGSEILFSRGRTLETWTVRADPDNPGAPPAVRRTDRLRLDRPSEGADPWFGEGELAPEVLRSWSVRDLDRDGHADLYRYDASRHALLFAFGAAGQRVLQQPDRILRIAGSPTATILHDCDGDGRPELELREEQDIRQPAGAVSILFGRGQRARLTIFRNRGARDLFAPHPSWVGSYVVRPRVGARSGRIDIGLHAIALTSCDFDGDGRSDLLLQPADGRLELYRGLEGTLFSDRVWRKVAIPADRGYRDIACESHDLDLDGRGDLVLHYRGWDGSPPEKIVVLISRLGTH